MKNKEIALCDQDASYITMFASYLLEKVNVGIHIFTTPESFFSDTRDFDIALMTDEFMEVSSFKQSGSIAKKYYLDENRKKEAGHIYKYQSMEEILNQVQEFKELKKAGKVVTRESESSNLIGVYSPISHELQLPFSMALGQSLEDYGKVLFLDLEELSIMPSLIGYESERNLSDLLYEMCSNKEKVDISDYVRHFMGFDYVSPFLRPDEIGQIDEESWKIFFNKLRNMDYDHIVVLFGRAICGFSEILGMVDQLYVLGKPGDYFKKGHEAFIKYVENLDKDVSIKNVLLPMSATNLTEGTYCIEELLQGKLGLFVKRELVVA